MRALPRLGWLLCLLVATAAAQTPTAVPAYSPTAPAVAPATGPTVPTNFYYTLRPGDTVDIFYRYTPEFNDEVVVGPDGRASLKSTGTIQMAGLTVPELQRAILRDSAERLVNPDVIVSLKDFERPHVVVAGEVNTPGRFDLRTPITATQAILLAGGPKSDSALGRVLLFRRINADTLEVHVLQLGRHDASTRAANDLVLQPDDMLLVRHDKLSVVERYVKLANLGIYFDPLAITNRNVN